MDLRLIYALILTILPVTELRVGLPLGIKYAIDNNINVFLIFLVVLLLNILVIFFVFWFLDNMHELLMNWKFYRNLFNSYLKKFQRKIDKFESRHRNSKIAEVIGLILFVGIPLPGTGAWTGCLLAWLLKLDRKKSILGISIGILIAGLIIFLGSLGFFGFF